MSGFAEARRSRAGATAVVTLKAVNHRFLDLRWQIPPEWESLQPELEKHVRMALHRGHVDIRVSGAARSEAADASLNDVAVEAYLAAHAEMNRRLGTGQPIVIHELLRFPGVLATNAVPAAAAVRAVILDAMQAALEQLRGMRADEGAALATDLRTRLQHVTDLHDHLRARRQGLEAGLLARMQARLQELAGDAFAANPERLLQEAALAAERGDIAEELTRLEMHCAAFIALLDEGGEVGKRLDFLTQEMNREINTLLSKSTGASPDAMALSQTGIALRSEVEKIREQVQNLE